MQLIHWNWSTESNRYMSNSTTDYRTIDVKCSSGSIGSNESTGSCYWIHGIFDLLGSVKQMDLLGNRSNGFLRYSRYSRFSGFNGFNGPTKSTGFSESTNKWIHWIWADLVVPMDPENVLNLLFSEFVW